MPSLAAKVAGRRSTSPTDNTFLPVSMAQLVVLYGMTRTRSHASPMPGPPLDLTDPGRHEQGRTTSTSIKRMTPSCLGRSSPAPRHPGNVCRVPWEPRLYGSQSPTRRPHAHLRHHPGWRTANLTVSWRTLAVAWWRVAPTAREIVKRLLQYLR